MKDLTQTHVYKARDKKSGLYFSGGAYGSFTCPVGVAFANPGACKCSLSHYVRRVGRYAEVKPSVEIVEFALTESRVVGDHPI